MTYTKKSDEMPVTQRMLDETRNELKSDIASLKLETKSGFESVKSEVSRLDSSISRLDSKMDSLASKVEEVLSAIHHVKAISEEQENRNKYVLDGHTSLHDRQDRLETEVDERIGRIESIISKMNN